MRIGLTGASGFIGRHFIAAARSAGHDVIAYSRRPVPPVAGAAETRAIGLGSPMDFSGLDALVNLAGESIVGIWTAEKRRRIRGSRIDLTREIVGAFGRMDDPPRTFVCASAIGFYGDRGDEILTESSAGGTGFLAEITRDWEAAALEATAFGLRVVCLRIGLAAGRDGGAFPLVRRIFSTGLAGRLGSGRQWMSWIHVRDAAGLIAHALGTDSLTGPVNAVSPGAVTNSEFTRVLARSLHRPALIPVPAFALRFSLGGMASLVLDSQHVVPQKAIDTGFRFEFPELTAALGA